MPAPWTTRRAVAIVCLCSLPHLGCSQSSDVEAFDDAMIERVAELPGARQSPNVELREEIARLDQEQETPLLLDQQFSVSSAPEASPLTAAFGELPLEDLAQQSDEILPRPGFEVGPIELEKLSRFRATYESQRDQVRQWVTDAPEHPPIDLRRGLFNETSFIPAAALASRLELMLGVERLQAGEVVAAVDSFEAALLICEQLAAAPHLAARLQAIELRADVLNFMAAVVRHDNADRKDVQRIQELLSDTLARWPDAADVWRADRAVGLHTYEIIRAGYLLQILTPEEVDQFAEELILPELEAATLRSIDTDQLFYLRAMNRLVDSCNKGEAQVQYHARTEVIREILQELNDRRGASDFPLIAARLLLPNIDMAQRRLAIDRARCEAWSLALATAQGSAMPQTQVSPVTGQPYVIDRQPTRVVVRGVTGEVGESPVIAPRFDVRIGRLP